MLTSIYELPFRIGEHYENWEFDLVVEELCNSYEMYKYVKQDIKMYAGFKVTDIFLYFSFDTLFQVEVFMERGSLTFKEFHQVKDGISIRAESKAESKAEFGLIQLTYNKNNIWREIM